MQEVKSHEQSIISFRQITNSQLSRTHVFRVGISHVITSITAQPATIFFVLFSLVLGSAIAFIVPPLRGPDEIAHFVRIYSYVHGELLPSAELDGRKGTFVKRELYHKLYFFKTAGEQFATARQEGMRYGQIMRLYDDLAVPLQDEVDGAAIFAPFAGTEGYNPVAYLPYIAAGIVGEKLDFPQLLLLMRLFGLVAFTAAVAYAIWVIPALKWSFVIIALLPVSLYNRSVLSADGAALSSAMVITALCLRSVARGPDQAWNRAFWMTLCALSKQAQIIFVLLELMISPMKELRHRWASVAYVILPSLILSPLWVFAVSADIAAWRLQLEEYHPPEHFDPVWKLVYMWDHPFHFPMAMLRAISGWWQRLWQELIGMFLSQERWDQIKRDQRSTVSAQMLLNPSAGNEATFQPAWLRNYDVIPAVMNVYIMCDPSKGTGERSDRTAIVVIGVDQGGNKYLLDGVRHRMKLTARWEFIKSFRRKWQAHHHASSIRSRCILDRPKHREYAPCGSQELYGRPVCRVRTQSNAPS